MKLSNKKIYLFVIVVMSVFFIGNICLAAGFINEGTKGMIDNQAYRAGVSSGGYSDVGKNDIFGLIQTVINAFLSIIGVLLLSYLLYAGYNWMTAQGEEEKVEKAKDTIKRAIVGAIIIVGAYAISVFVMGRLEQGTLKAGSSQPPAAAQP